MSEDYEPVRVHLASVEAGIGGAPAAAARPRRTATYETFVLTANDPVMAILPPDPEGRRTCAYVQAIDNDVVLGPTAGVAGAAANTVTNVPNPNGTYLPKANTAPYPVEDSGPVFAGVTTTASASRVAVTAVYEG